MKKSIKKILCTAVTASVLSTMLVGCGGTASTSSSNEANGQTTLTYAIWDTVQQPGMQKMVDTFEKKYPNIKVNIEVTPWDQYWTKMQAAGSGGNLPDVFWNHATYCQDFAEAGLLADLTDKIKNSKELELDKLPTEVTNIYSYGGKNYAVPKDIDSVGLWYNKALFDKAGVKYPDDTWTWDDFLNAAKKLTNADQGTYGFAARLDTAEGIYPFIYQNGGDLFTDNKTKIGYSLPKTKEALQWYVDLSLKEKVSPTQQQFDENKALAYFESGKVAMALFGSWMTAEFAANEYTSKNCDVAVLPKGKTGTRATISNGLGFSIAATSKNQDAAWKFVEYMGSKEAQQVQGESGVVIPAYAGARDAWVNSCKTFNLKAFIQMLDYYKIKPYAKNSAKWSEIETNELKKVFSGESTVDQTCEELSKQIDPLLK